MTEFKDAVRDTTTTEGTGTITLGGIAPAGYQSVATAHTASALVQYRIETADRTEWENGEGALNVDKTTMTRVVVTASSNAGALVDFSAGTKTVITTVLAKSVGLGNSFGAFTSANLATALTDETGTGLAVFNDSPKLSTPTLVGTLAQTVTVDRETTADTAGKSLTINAGGATVGATNKAGGDLILKPGIPTGTGTSAVRIFTGSAGSTGTADVTLTEKVTILGNGNVGIGIAPAYKLDIGSNPIRCSGINGMDYTGLSFNSADVGPVVFYVNNLEKFRVTSSATSPICFGCYGGDHYISIGGNVARSLGVQRHGTANTAGNSLTIQAGGATSVATDKAGGNLLLKPGLSTGTGTSSIELYASPAGSTGTADNTLTKYATLSSTALAIETFLVVPKTQNVGIKIDTAAPTYPWADIIGQVTPRAATPNQATLNVFRGGQIRNWCFANGDRSDNVFHIPHDYVMGTDLFIHVHWAHNGTAISGNAVMNFYCSYAKGHNQENFTAEKNTTITYNTTNIATTPQYRHRVDEVAITGAGGSATLIDNALIEVDGLLLVNFDFTTIPTITGGSPNQPFVFTIDIHYQSTGIGTKQKAPPFWT